MADGKDSGTVATKRVGPKRAWLARAEQAGRNAVDMHIRTWARSGCAPIDMLESAFADWVDDLEWRRPSAFYACARAKRFMRAAFAEGFAACVYEWETEEPNTLRWSCEP
jgi:hypothetical protein